MKRVIALVLPLVFASCADLGPTTPSFASDSPSFAMNARSADDAFSFATVEVPNAVFTSASGINAGGDIVGSYRDASGTHGFLLRGGEFTTIDFPGAAVTQARGVGPGGDIVGTYRLPGETALTFHGFVLTRQGEFVPAFYPGYTNTTIPQRILPDGTILGCRHAGDLMASMRGIVISTRGNSEIEAFASMHNGATPDLRRIVGLYVNMMEGPPGVGRREGYMIDDGVFTPLLVPGSTFTQAWDVNPAGVVVGVYRNSTGSHGFVLRENGYAPVDVPGAAASQAFGINARGDVVGDFIAGDGRTRGFIAEKSR